MNRPNHSKKSKRNTRKQNLVDTVTPIAELPTCPKCWAAPVDDGLTTCLNCQHR